MHMWSTSCLVLNSPEMILYLTKQRCRAILYQFRENVIPLLLKVNALCHQVHAAELTRGHTVTVNIIDC